MTDSKRKPDGFTMIEMMMVVAVIAILAMIALPSMQARIVRGQVVEALKLVDFVKLNVGGYYGISHDFPSDNDAASVPPSKLIVSKLVSDVAVRNGVITLTFGNDANGALRGKRLSLRPAYVPDFPQVPLAWVCAGAAVPDKMKASGRDETDIAQTYLPVGCRSPGAPK